MAELRFPDPPLGDEAVVLRRFREADVPAIVAICRDPEVRRWTSVPSPYDESDAREFLVYAEDARLRGHELQLVLAHPAEGRMLGALGLHVGAEHAIGQIGYYLAPDARGRGLATRALRLMAAWAVRDLDLKRLEVLANPDNVASQRVALKAGFEREGLMRSYRERKGEREDLWMFPLLPPELAPA